MNDAAGSLESAFRIVECVASSVLSQIGGIGSRINEIKSAASVVSDISDRLSSEAEQLESEVAEYVLASEEAPDDADVESLSAAVIDETAD